LFERMDLVDLIPEKLQHLGRSDLIRRCLIDCTALEMSLKR